VKIEDAPVEKVSIDEIKKAPEVIIAQSIFDISDRSNIPEEEKRSFMNAHG